MIFYVFCIGMANSLTQMLLHESDAKTNNYIVYNFCKIIKIIV